MRRAKHSDDKLLTGTYVQSPMYQNEHHTFTASEKHFGAGAVEGEPVSPFPSTEDSQMAGGDPSQHSFIASHHCLQNDKFAFDQLSSKRGGS